MANNNNNNNKTNKIKLDIKGVSKVFPDEQGKYVEALKDTSLFVQDKEFVALVGPSGCGKTTLLNIVAGLISPTQGQVALNGKTVTQPSREKGLVFQHPASFPWLTVTQNVEFGMNMRGVSAKRAKEKAEYYIDLVGLSGFESSYVSSLSGGMKQRVALATVLANDPEVLLMDEPFSALDTQTRALMQELILTIWEETRKSVLFVTHDIEEAIFLADRVYVMSARPGEIKEVITVDMPRPRAADVKFTNHFLKIKKHISYIIRSETVKAAQIRAERLGKPTLKVGLHSWTGNVLFYLAEELGLYDKYHLNLELVSLEKKGEARIEALQNDEVDVMNMTADGAVLAKAQGMDIQAFLCLNRSHGGDALIARPGIKHINDLRGKTIATEKKWVSHHFLLYLMDKYKMKEKDVTIVDMKGSDIGAALITQKVDAAVLWEPWLTQAVNMSGSSILVSTEDEPVVIDILTAKEDTLVEKAESIQTLVHIWHETLEYMQKNQDKVEKLMTVSFPFGFSLSDLNNQLQKVTFIGEHENKRLLNVDHKRSLSKTFDAFSRVLRANNIIAHKISGGELINASFL